MPTTRYSEENLTFLPPQQWTPQWQPQYFPGTIYTTFVPGAGTSHISSSESEFSAPENFPESSNSPLRSPDTTTPEDVAAGGAPFLQFVEPPIESYRFRYPTEMKGTHGPIAGISTAKKENAKKRIYPSVKLCNYIPSAQDEKIIIRCTITTADANEKDRVPHVHHLKGKGKTIRSQNRTVEIDDPIDIEVSSPNYQATFGSMTILYIKKDAQLKELLSKKKRHMRKRFINPQLDPSTIYANTDEKELVAEAQADIMGMNLNRLNTACLKFEALRGGNGRIMYEPIPNCKAIYSNPIKNNKNSQFNDLKICRIDKVAGSCLGKEEVFIFVDRVNKKDIKVRFFELNGDEEEVWEADAELNEDDVHFQYAIAFRTPRYRNVEISENVRVYFQLVRPSNDSRSEPKAFEYTPDSRRWQDEVRKRRKLESPPIPATVHDFSRPSSSAASTWNYFDRSSNEGHPPVSFLTSPAAAPSESSSMTVGSSDHNWADITDLLKDFPDFDTMEAMDALSAEEDLSLYTQPPHSSLNEALSSFSSGDSDMLHEMIKTQGALEQWANCNGVANNLIQDIRSQVMSFDDLVTDGGTSRSNVKFQMAYTTAIPKTADHQSVLTLPQKTTTPGHKGVSNRVQFRDQNKCQLTRENIASKVEKVVNGLLKLKGTGKIQERDMKRCLLKAFTVCVGDEDDSVLHVLACNETFSSEFLKYLQVLQIYNITEKVVNLRNRQQKTALHLAAEKGSLQTIAILVEYGADINARDSNLNTAVHLVARRSQNDGFHAVGHILEKNPDLSIHNADGLTALHVFVMCRKSDITSSLIMKQENENSSIDIINLGDRKQGNTALHIAVQKRFKEIVILLLNFDDRIEVNVKNFEDKTPLAYVWGENDPDSLAIEELLLENKADPSLVQGRSSKVLKEVDELKNEIDNNSQDEEFNDVDESLPSYALDWKSGAELKLMDAKTVCSVCPVLDENNNWEKLLRKLDFNEDIHAVLEYKWSPSLYLLKSIAEAMPHMTSEHLRDTLIKINPECKKAAQFIDDMILCNMGVF